MKTKIVFGNAHTLEAIEEFQRENAEKIEGMIVSGVLERPITNDMKSLKQNERSKRRS